VPAHPLRCGHSRPRRSCRPWCLRRARHRRCLAPGSRTQRSRGRRCLPPQRTAASSVSSHAWIACSCSFGPWPFRYHVACRFRHAARRPARRLTGHRATSRTTLAPLLCSARARCSLQLRRAEPTEAAPFPALDDDRLVAPARRAILEARRGPRGAYRAVSTVEVAVASHPRGIEASTFGAANAHGHLPAAAADRVEDEGAVDRRAARLVEGRELHRVVSAVEPGHQGERARRCRRRTRDSGEKRGDAERADE